MSIKFTIDGPPMGKERPRVTKRGTYTPKKTLEREDYIKLLVRQQWSKSPWSGAVKLNIHIVYRRPKRLPKDRYWPSCRPDGDNVEKLILDSLNGVLYTDDSNVVSVSWLRRYTVGLEEPHTDVEVTLLRPQGARGRYNDGKVSNK